MATTPRQQIGSPAIFTSDPLEQKLAGIAYGDNPATAGYAMGGLLNAKMERGMDQDTYLTNLHQANALSYALAQQDMKNDLTKEALGQIANAVGKGINPNEIPAFASLYSDPNASSDPSGASGLHRALLAAQAEEARQKAAHAGDAGADTVTYTQQMGAYGPEGGQIVVKSKDPTRGAQTIGTLTAQRTQQSGLPAPPPGQPYARTGAKPGQAAQTFMNNQYNR